MSRLAHSRSPVPSTHPSIALAAAVACLASGACSEVQGAADTAEQRLCDDADVVAGDAIIGTYVAYRDDENVLLTFKSDGRFRQATDPIGPEQELVTYGNYDVRPFSETTKLLSLETNNGTEYLALELDGQDLKLRPIGNPEWEILERLEIGVCDVAADCGLQGYSATCPGSEWVCHETNQCVQSCDESNRTFARLTELLGQEGIWRRPAVAIAYDVPVEEISVRVDVIDTPDGVEQYAKERVNGILADYRENDGDEVLFLFDYPDLEVNVQSGTDNTSVRAELLDTLLDPALRDEVSYLLRHGVDYFRLTLNDTGAEMLGQELIILQPSSSRLPDTGDRALAIQLEYSEEY